MSLLLGQALQIGSPPAAAVPRRCRRSRVAAIRWFAAGEVAVNDLRKTGTGAAEWMSSRLGPDVFTKTWQHAR
jgi:hypothetical protein